MGVKRRLSGFLAVLLLAVEASAAPLPRPVTVFAAASLTDVLEQLGAEYTRSTGIPVRFSFAASAALARQIEAGAGADLFLPADPQWMDYLEQRGRIQTSTRSHLLGNRLVLIAPAQSTLQLKIAPGFALGRALDGRRLAVGDPDSVPAGRYAKIALSRLGVWNEVVDRLVRAEDVRHALLLVARGEVPLGIVYETDARASRSVRVVDTFPAATHPPVTYPVALVAGAGTGASRFLDFLRGPAARIAFERAGFDVRPAGKKP
jgi:molybdate transport system substrate-binding protein